MYEYSSEFSNFGDDTTPYECGKNYDEVINKLEDTIEKLFNWFQCNNFKANASKCHFFLSPYKPVTIKIKESAIESSNSEKLLGVTIDSKLSFDDHITILCRKTSQKLHALSRVATYMSFDKKRILLKTFITPQFNYCPLVWMCHSTGLNNTIENLHERALRIVYQDKKSDFETLLKNDKSVTIHVRNLHYLVTDVYKVKNNISPEIMREIFHFQENENYNLRSGTHLASRNMRTTLFGKETVSNLGAKIWPLLPEELKNASSLQIFKNKLKEWKPISCPCRLCKTYVQHVGFI